MATAVIAVDFVVQLVAELENSVGQRERQEGEEGYSHIRDYFRYSAGYYTYYLLPDMF